MFERNSRRSTSTVSATPSVGSVALGTDLNRDPVYLSGEVVPSVAFAQAMLILGKVVQTVKPAKKDHSAYQAWVTQEYMRIFQEREPSRAQRLSTNAKKLMAAKLQRDKLLDVIKPLRSLVANKQSSFFDWLYQNDREAWIVLDPIVSVQKDGVFFEAFSGDESIYARVYLPIDSVSGSSESSLGTTNIDFSVALEKEFSRVRSYRPLNLTVGLKQVDFRTSAAVVEEEKIPLPDSWVRGLVEVQSVLGLAPLDFEMSSDALAEIISRLDSERERTGPRSLKFHLKPDSPIRIEIEPWGEFYSDDWCIYGGERSEVIRIWGRRRLKVLKDILVDTETVKVRFLGSGMPSFWTVVKDGVEVTVGLSGWTANDWASKARFSSFIPTANVRDDLLPSALEVIQSAGTMTTKEIANSLTITVPEAATVMQKLCLQGKVMFDPERNVFRWRNLFPTFDLYTQDEASRESKAGLEIYQSKQVKKTGDEVKDGIRYLSGAVTRDGRVNLPILELDSDNRPKYAQCNCPFYSHNRLRQGPCRDMIALLLIGDAQ